ncbi:MAG: GTPase Era [Burkholderiales bacterium]|nr:GTPase Era [Burkholderiales bacterium]
MNSDKTYSLETQNKSTFCGFISIVGRPNVGKSTLMNHLIGQKISITSRKPQTTQYRINGVHTKDNYQYIFVDTPGFQKRYINKINSLLNQSVEKSLSYVDAVLFVVEAGLFNEGDINVLALLNPESNVVLVVNKEDKLKNKQELNNFVKDISSKFIFKKVALVSAKHHFGVDEMLESLSTFLPEGDFLYPTEQLTDKNNTFMAQEIIREKIFRYLGEELPYKIAVEINEFKPEAKIIRIAATIIVDRENYKGIIIGKGGGKLKKISSDARLDMESLYDNKVFLQVWVKVKSGFGDDAKFLEQFE